MSNGKKLGVKSKVSDNYLVTGTVLFFLPPNDNKLFCLNAAGR